MSIDVGGSACHPALPTCEHHRRRPTSGGKGGSRGARAIARSSRRMPRGRRLSIDAHATGVAPSRAMVSEVEIKEKGVVMISSPGCTSSVIREISSASVPLATAVAARSSLIFASSRSRSARTRVWPSALWMRSADSRIACSVLGRLNCGWELRTRLLSSAQRSSERGCLQHQILHPWRHSYLRYSAGTCCRASSRHTSNIR